MSASNQQLEPNWTAPTMPLDVFRRAVEVFKIPSTTYDETSMSIHIAKRLDASGIPYKVDNYGNILVSKGEGNRPCFCAHLDTVHMYLNGFNVFSEKYKEHDLEDARVYLYAKDDLGKKVGIGGDDKCGIVVCLELLEALSNVKVVFFSSEESGGTGSAHIDIEFFKDCNFLGGIDRWNGKDFINSYCGDKTISKAFSSDIQSIMKTFGYTFNSGLFTDAFNVQGRKIGISCFNVSCGYYGHHSDMEYVDTNEVYNCLRFCLELGKLSDRYLYQITTPKFSKWENIGGVWYKDGQREDLMSSQSKYDWGTNSWKYDKDKQYNQGLRYRIAEAVKENSSKKEEEPVPVCAICGIELLAGERNYCYSCKINGLHEYLYD